MSTRILPTDYDRAARDFDSLKDRLQRSIQSVFPRWTDFGTANFGNILLEMLCYVGDNFAYYQDKQARESRFLTCVKRINGIRHARAIGYEFSGAEAATVDLLFALRQAYANDVSFPAGSVVRSVSATDPVRVQLLTDLTITAGNLTGTVSAENSLSHDEVFESDDTSDQEFELTFTPFLSIASITDSVGAYEIVSNFLDSTATDRHCVVKVSEDNRAVVRFGDGVNGRVPSGNITFDYKTGGGLITIEQGAMTIPEFTVRDSGNNPVAFDVTNPSGVSGGADYETLEHAQATAPSTVRATDRSVAREDFEINAARVSGVERALMLTADQLAGMAENYGQIHVVARGTENASGTYNPTTPSAAQLSAVRTLIENDYPPTITFRFDPLAVTFKTVDITARVYLAAGANAATVDALIRANLADFFAVTNADESPNGQIDFGYNYKDESGDPDPILAWSDLFNVVRDATGVRRVDEDAFIPADDVSLTIYEFPKLGTVTLINAATGLELV